MNNDELAERLQAAGSGWRASQPPPPHPDPARFNDRGPRRRAQLAVAAAVAVTAVSATAVALFRAQPGTPAGAHPAPAAARDSLDAVLLLDGDRVRAEGWLVGGHSRPATLCVGPALSGPISDPTCPDSRVVRLTGAAVEGARPGPVVVEGTWQKQTIQVSSLGPLPDPGDTQGPGRVPAPCATPPGGWQAGPLGDHAALSAYLKAHQDRFVGSYLAFPDGTPGGPTGAAGYTSVAQVMVVEVADADLARAQRDLAALYHGNLCTTHVPYSGRQLASATAQVNAVLGAAGFPREAGAAFHGDGVQVIVPFVDQTLFTKLAAIEGDFGEGLLDFQVRIRRIG